MSGIYIHIPFCVTRCIYCDFYSSTLKGRTQQYVEAVVQEAEDRRHYLPQGEPIRTLYLGGGTPTQLTTADLRTLFERLAETFDLSQLQEVTLEANPEDLTPQYIEELVRDTPVNRISMGVQSFDDAELKLLHRRHDARRPQQAIEQLREAGIRNISIDLMYGLPTQTLQSWQQSIAQAIALPVQHISAYCLSVEPGTAMERLVQSGRYPLTDDDLCNTMAEVLRQQLAAAGFEQYEISNYARPGFASQHNSNYWNGTAYLGLGPGAHSFDGRQYRGYNLPDIDAYLEGNRSYQQEALSATEQYNEAVMLQLRTSQGISISQLERRFAQHPDLLAYFHAQYPPIVAQGLLRQQGDTLVLTPAGLNLADEVMRELIYIDE